MNALDKVLEKIKSRWDELGHYPRYVELTPIEFEDLLDYLTMWKPIGWMRRVDQDHSPAWLEYEIGPWYTELFPTQDVEVLK